MGKRERGNPVSLDSLIDIITCVVGVLVMIIMLTGVDAAQTKVLIPTPMEVPSDKRSTFIECRNNQLFLVPVAQINDMANEELRKIARQVKGDTRKMMDLLATSTIETDSYTVDLTYALLVQFALKPKPGAPGYVIKDPRKEMPTDWFGKIVSAVDRNEEIITFLVRDDSYEVFKKARAVAWIKGIDVSYELLDVSDPLKFGLGGTHVGIQ
jgi:hypothetical protein